MVSKECVTVTAPHAAIPPAMKDPIVVDMSPSLQPPLLLLLLPACGCRVCILLLHVHADGEVRPLRGDFRRNWTYPW